jgi:glyoxylate reductase
MPKPKVWLTRAIHPHAQEKIIAQADVEIWPYEDPPSHSDILKIISKLDGILTLLTDPIDRQVIEAAKNLKVISQMAVGYDNIDIQAATHHNIAVGHTPGVLTETTADFTWALLLATARRVAEADQQVRQGIWKPWGPDVLTGVDVFGATLGIVGLGRIGKAVAQRARGFSMQVLYYNRDRDAKAEKELGVVYAPLDELLQRSDYISLHIYYSSESHHLFNRGTFERMKPSSILINTARGAIVDPHALVWALKEKKIAAAGLDVFDPEPIPANHPIREMCNVVLTPHIASASIETRKRMAIIAAENLLAGLEGQALPYCANPEVYG